MRLWALFSSAAGERLGNDPGRSVRFGMGAIFLLGAVWCLFALGSQRTLGTHEAFVAVPAQEMLTSGDWLIPRFAGKPRFQKPPLPYWIVAALGGVVGRVDAFLARLPEALCTWTVAAVLCVLAWHWFGTHAAFATAVMQFSSAWVLTYGRRAEPDMALTLLWTLAWGAFFRILEARQSTGGGPRRCSRIPISCEPEAWEAHRSRSADGVFEKDPGQGVQWPSENESPTLVGRDGGEDAEHGDEHTARRRRLWTAILCLLGASWLIKFHYTPALFVASLVVFAVWERRWDWLRGAGTPVGWSVFGACALGWPVLVWLRAPEAIEVWYRETIGRAEGMLGHDPWWDYLPKLFAMPLPWTPWVAWGLWRLARVARRGDVRARWLIASIIGQLALITAQPSKHANYALGIMPLLTLAAAEPLGNYLAWLWASRWRMPAWFATGVAVAAVGGVAAGVHVSLRRWPHLESELMTLGGVAVAVVTAAVALGAFGRHKHGLVTLGAGWVVMFCAFHAVVLPRVDRRAADARFGRVVRGLVGKSRAIFLYRLNQTPEALDPIAFYVGAPVVRLEGPFELEERLARAGELIVVCYTTDLDELAAMVAVERLRSERPPREVRLPHPPFALVRVQSGIDGHRRPGRSPDGDAGTRVRFAKHPNGTLR
ncbi:MAG: hypothetical protein D6725_05155 [Planctomycetota bacterium]|nr:MAG: hypothetical protein D6725_05155 [Planctomycetota bacterium]